MCGPRRSARQRSKKSKRDSQGGNVLNRSHNLIRVIRQGMHRVMRQVVRRAMLMPLEMPQIMSQAMRQSGSGRELLRRGHKKRGITHRRRIRTDRLRRISARIRDRMKAKMLERSAPDV